MTQQVPASMTVEGLTAGGVATSISNAVAAEAAARNTAIAASFAVFKGTANAVTSVTNTPVKITLQSEAFDTGGWFDTTNSRFLPLKAGYYQVNGCLRFATSGSSCYVAIYKNGALYQIGNYGIQDCGTVSDVVYLNGTTDYIELWGQSTSTQNSVTSQTYLSGCLVRPD